MCDSSYHGVQTSLKLRAFLSAGVTGMHHSVSLTNIPYYLFLIVYGGKLCISVPLGGAVHECAMVGGELCMSVPCGVAVHECAFRGELSLSVPHTVHMSRPDDDYDCWLLGTEQVKGRWCSMNLQLCWMPTVISS